MRLTTLCWPYCIICNVKLTENEPSRMLHMAYQNFDGKLLFLPSLPNIFESHKR